MVSRVVKGTAYALLAAVLSAVAVAPAEAACVPWKSAGVIIAQNSLIPGNVIYQMVQSKTSGKVISATLCESGGKFVYKIVVLDKTGQVTNLSVDARTGRF